MSELTDDQLDGLFRKSAEEFDPPFDPAAWQDMKARLDTTDYTAPAGTFSWKNLLRWGLPIALLVILTGSGWYAYTKTQSTEKETLVGGSNPGKTIVDQSDEKRGRSDLTKPGGKISGETKATESLKNTDGSASEPANQPEMVAERIRPTAPAENSDNVNAEPKKSRVPVVSVATKLGSPAYSVKTGHGPTARTRAGLPAENSSQAENSLRSVSVQRRREKGLATKRTRARLVNPTETIAFSTTDYVFPKASSFSKQRRRANPKSEQINSVNPANTGTVTTPEPVVAEEAGPLLINELNGRSARWAKPLPFVGRSMVLSVPSDTSERTAVQAAPPIVQRGFSVRFVVSPDLSTVGLKNFTRPGTNAGLLLEYRLANRWSVQGGVIWSTKVYKAGTEDYVVPDGMWAYPFKKPESVDGRCIMIDIPLNVRYDFLLQPRMDGRLPSRWFISGGLTTYIMNREDYHYDYPAHTYGQKTDWTNPNTGTAFGLSNLNLSVGYERSFGKRLSWQVEPFMKVPLKGVGVYKINLLSTGSFFSIRYKL
jgi:hypothetical protein